MANALSMDLRTRFKKLMEDGLRAAAAEAAYDQPGDGSPLGEEGTGRSVS